MNCKNVNVVLLGVFTVLMSALNAQAEDKSRLIVSMVVVGVKSQPSFSATSDSVAYPGYAPKWSYGGGLLFGIPVINSLPGPIDSFYKIFRALNLDLELGLLYVNRNYPSGTDPATLRDGVPKIGTSQTLIQLPILLRFGDPLGLSMGGGVYYGLNRTQSSATNFKDNEFGAVMSAQASLGRRFGYGFIVDGRYTFSLTNTTTTAAITRFTDFQLLAGIRI